MTGHRFSVKHEEQNKPIALHAKKHDENKLENCYNLIGMKKVKFNENENLNRYHLRKSELAHQLILKTKTQSGLNLQ